MNQVIKNSSPLFIPDKQGNILGLPFHLIIIFFFQNRIMIFPNVICTFMGSLRVTE